MEQKLQLRVQLIVLFDNIYTLTLIKVWILVDLILLKQIEAELTNDKFDISNIDKCRPNTL